MAKCANNQVAAKDVEMRHNQGRNIERAIVQLCNLPFVGFFILTLDACAAPMARPALPCVEYADTETVTNMAFTAWEQGMREFRFDLEFGGTASNNVEMAFGTDADGDGILTDDEVSVIAGWDCGELFIANNAADGRISETAASGPHDFSCVFEMRPNWGIARAAFSDNGSQVFSGISAAKPSWLYSAGWNMVRMTGRGENIRDGERFSAKITAEGFAIHLK